MKLLGNVEDRKMNNLKNELTVYLDEIAERLWSGHATVMVGAGFSKNATKGPLCSKSFLNWYELADIFYKKIHGIPPSDREHYLNPLKLADEVQAAFGRQALEYLMRSELPDMEYNPSLLHEELMSLPWCDVFTTNYDTLLERATTKISQKRYDVVINEKDLVYSQKPRIIKLHGSFPSQRPFIITEEDYRKYPKKHPLFVNTVQQSLIENTLCLIGFSGDDPNFLHWIGWIRDNLGIENAPKIYLVGILNLSHAQSKLLEQRNIVTVDLSFLIEQNPGDHSAALRAFIHYLSNKAQEEDKLNWANDETSFSLNSNLAVNVISTEIEKITSIWRTSRINYPGWVVCPSDQRQVLWRNTRTWLNGKHLNIELHSSLEVDFWFELSWRLEKCLLPYFDHLVEKIEALVYRRIVFEKELVPKPNDSLIQEKCIFLALSLLRHYREEGLSDKWNDLEKKLTISFESWPADQRNKLYYERCLFDLFNQEIKNLKVRLNSWPLREASPFDQAKKAGLLAELGDVQSAKKILEDALQIIRSQLNLVPITTDYTMVSQEAHVMHLLMFVSDSQDLLSERQDYTSRWNKLRGYKCDPWEEMEFFKHTLECPYIEKADEKEVFSFDIGHRSVTRYFGDNEQSWNGFAFLRFVEDVGLPFQISSMGMGSSQAIGAVERIKNFSPFWATTTLLRVGDVKAIDLMFDRTAFVNRLTTIEVDSLIEKYLKLLSDVSGEIVAANGFRNQNIGTHLINFLPELMSRLCVKCSTEYHQKLFNYLVSIYSSGSRAHYHKTEILTKRLVNSWQKKDLLILIQQILEKFPIRLIGKNHHQKFPDPLTFVDLSFAKDIDCSLIKIAPSVIKELIENIKLNSEEREIAFRRILIIHDLECLAEEDIKEFADAIWSIKDTDGFPAHLDDYYKFSFLRFPVPESVDLKKTVANFVSGLRFLAVSKNNGSLNVTNGRIRACDELLGLPPFMETTIPLDEEVIVKVLIRLIDWWDADKELFSHDEGGGFFMNKREELIARFAKCQNVIAKFVIPFLSDESLKKYEEVILKAISEMDLAGIGTAETRVSLALRSRYPLDDLLESLKEEILSLEAPATIRGINSLVELIIELDNIQFKNKAIELVVDCLRWRRNPAVHSALANLNYLFKKGLGKELMKLEGDILLSLAFLQDETKLKKGDYQKIENQKLEAREYAAALAFSLYQFYVEEKPDIPVVIERWKMICNDPEEFWEIRNSWG